MDGYDVRRRPWSAAAAVLGLVGSMLLAGGAAPPAGAAAGEADNEPVYSACVGPALTAAGLVDVVGSFAEDAVNCLAHFGVTRGRTATEYDPGAPVLRQQMALFLARAAGPAGVVLPANPESGFTDIEGVLEEARTAIAQMTQLGIMRGQSSTSFGPEKEVLRVEMAEMLDSFLDEAELGLGALGGNADELSDISPDDDVFDDIEGVTRGQHAAIRRMFEAGVTRGTVDGGFKPNARVTRAQMAVFITRMLAHTTARPAGVTVQAAASEATEGEFVNLAVSVRDSDLQPMPNAVVDVFSAADPDDAFRADGRCSIDAVSPVGGSAVCRITVGDSATGPSGDLELSTNALAESSTFWAWTGDAGDVYDADDTEGSSVRIAVSKPGAKLRITDDMPEGATSLKFGDRVVFTLQVVDEDGEAAPRKDVSVNVGVSETVTAGGADGAPSTSSSSLVYKTDASGKIELSFRHTDPRTGSGNTGDTAHLDLDVTLPAGSGLMLEDKTNLEKAGAEAGTGVDDAAAVWRDSAPTPTTLVLSQDIQYHEASAAGNGASNMVRATLTDQFGGPVARQRITFTSDDPDGIGAAAASAGAPAALVFDIDNSGDMRLLTGESRWARMTNRQGAATLAYNRKSSDGGIETILAEAVVGSGADARTIEAERVYHYWAEEPANGASTQGRILVADTGNNRLVIGGVNVALIAYDGNDQFTNADPVTLSDFEEYLEETAEHASVTGYQTDRRNVSNISATPEWTGIDHPDGITAGGAARFGQAVAVDNGVIVVGASRETVGGQSRAGAVYVYTSVGDSNPTKLTAASPAEKDYFGYDLDIAGDTIVVGAYGRGTHGAAYVFTKPSSGWGGDMDTNAAGVYELTDTGATTWDKSDTADTRGHNFGSGVAISKDGGTVVVSSPDDRRSDNAEGWVRVFEKPAGGWADSDGANVPALVVKEGGDLGYSWNPGKERGVAVSSDGSVVVVGVATTEKDSLINAGRAYVFVEPDGGWDTTDATPSTATLTAPTPTSYQLMANYVGVSDDGSTVVASGHFNHQERKLGEMYVFTKPSGGWEDSNAPAVLSIAGGRTSDVFGHYVTISGDGGEAAAGRHYRQEGDWRGSAVVFTRPSGGWETTSQPADEYLGSKPQHRLGWATTFDKSNGDLYSSWRRNTDNGGRLLTLFKIDR